MTPSGPARAKTSGTPRGTAATRGGVRASVLLAACVTLLALPSAVLAFSTSFDAPARPEALDGDAAAASATARFARALSVRATGGRNALFPFTPAGTPNRPDRSVTVAVRVDPQANNVITVRGRSLAQLPEAEMGRLRIAPTAFNLGVSRGYHNFAQDIAQVTKRAAPAVDVADMGKFTLAPGAKPAESRFSPRFSLDGRPLPGRTARSYAADAGEVDVGGAYRVTDRLDVTAGVRYSQDRNRIAPLDDSKQDSQAVYVGTQFHF